MKIQSDDKIWMIFGFADDGLPEDVEEGTESLYRVPPPVLAFRLHVGVLDADVRRQVTASIITQVKKMDAAWPGGVTLHKITAYAAPLSFTINGQQRWVGRDLTETLYQEDD